MTVSNDITEEFQYDISRTNASSTYQPTQNAIDISINDLPFLLKIDNQNPYRRETAQYKKDQFDNSAEPGEQSFTGWWLRSQTSFHNGAGIEFYEPGTDYEHVSHRFNDSRGVDVWTVGEAGLHKDVFHAYTASGTIGGFNADTGNDGTSDVLVVGDEAGVLKKVALNGNSSATTTNYTAPASSYLDDHNGSNHPIYSVATDGLTYYAVCDSAVHTGTIGTAASDDLYFRYSSSTSTNAFIKYAKGYMFFAHDNKLAVMSTTQTHTSATHTTGTVDTFGGAFLANYRTHINSSWIWTDVAASPGPVFASGNGGNRGEIYKFSMNVDTSIDALDMAAGVMVLSMPEGETINAIHYYLGYLAVGTNKGVRICPVNGDGSILMGPLLIETAYNVNGFTERGSYLYAATKADDTSNTNAILIRIDLSQQFNDGTFAYAYDLEYQSSLDGDSSNCTEVYVLDDRLVMVIEEDGVGELQVEHTENRRASGWLQTGKIRFATVEPKFFKYIQTRGAATTGDSISVQSVSEDGTVYDLITLDAASLGSDVGLKYPTGKQEFLSIKFTLTNGSSYVTHPKIYSYQIKAIPAIKRQRIYQYPLSCFDVEMDRFNATLGYSGRTYDTLQLLETLEETGDFVTVRDYRTNETYNGVIEEVRFINESSPDKDNNGFGGILIVTIRKY